MEKIIWIILIFLIGILLPFQAGLNTRLGNAAGSPIVASFLSFTVGAILLGGYVLATRPEISWQEIKAAPPYLWLGGVIGALYVTFTILAFPKLGPGLMFGLVVAGQMTASIFLEHRNILVAQQHPVTWLKVLGVGLIIAGVILIRKE